MPSHGIYRHELPREGHRLEERPKISAARYSPSVGRNLSGCSGMGSFTIYMQTDDAKSDYSGYVVF